MNQHHSALSEILEKNIFFSIFEKLFTLYTKPKLAKIRPKIGFSQAIWLHYWALGEILETIRVVKNYSHFRLNPIYPKLGPKSIFLGQND